MRLLLLFAFGIQLGFSQDLILQGVNVIPVSTNSVINNCDVVIKEGKIEKIVPTTSMPYSKKFKVMDCRGKFVMPGLADMHAHFPDDKSPVALKEYLNLQLAAGVTTLRSMRGTESQLGLRDSIRSRKKIAPHMYISYVLNDKDSLWTNDTIEKIVSEAQQKKYDFIKYLGGITPEHLNEISASCKKHNINMAGHAYKKSLQKSMEAGFTSIEHYQPVLSAYVKDSANFGNIVTLMKDKHTAICPTLSFYNIYSFRFTEEELLNRKGMEHLSKQVKEEWLSDYKKVLTTTQQQLNNDFDAKYKNVYKKQFSDFNHVLKKLADAGVLILLSPDDGIFNVPGFSMAEEMKLYKEAGLTNYQILRAATLNAAIYFKEDKSWGSVEKGRKADLVLLNANPLENIENVSKVEGTVLNGNYYSQKELLAH